MFQKKPSYVLLFIHLPNLLCGSGVGGLDVDVLQICQSHHQVFSVHLLPILPLPILLIQRHTDSLLASWWKGTLALPKVAQQNVVALKSNKDSILQFLMIFYNLGYFQLCTLLIVLLGQWMVKIRWLRKNRFSVGKRKNHLTVAIYLFFLILSFH